MLRSKAHTAAQIGWKLYLDKQLPADRHDWLFERLGVAGEYARLVRLAEGQLQAGNLLNQNQLDWLATAYAALGQVNSARRARTTANEIKLLENRQQPSDNRMRGR